MKSIANQYRDLKEGKMSQQNFMRNLRMTMPQYVTNVTSFGDEVKILKNKSIIVETTVKENFDRDCTKPTEATINGKKIPKRTSVGAPTVLNAFIIHWFG